MKSNTLTAGDAIRAFLKAYNLEDKMMETKILSVATSVLGDYVNNHLDKVVFRNHTLTLFIKNAALRQELEYSKSEIRLQINRELGTEIIHSLVVR